MGRICLDCGRVSDEDVDFCTACGSMRIKELDASDINNVVNEVSKGFTALALALIPGIFNVFGLGHLLLKRYVAGLLFLAFSVVYYGMFLSGSYADYASILEILSLIIYVIQSVHLYSIVVSRGRRGKGL